MTDMGWSAPVVKLARRLYEQSAVLNPRQDDKTSWEALRPSARDYWCALVNDLLNDETTLQEALKLNRA